MEMKQPSPEGLAFIRDHKDKLNEVAEACEWMRTNLLPFMEREGLEGNGWFLKVSEECFKRES